MVEVCRQHFCARVLKNNFEIYPSITDVFFTERSAGHRIMVVSHFDTISVK